MTTQPSTLPRILTPTGRPIFTVAEARKTLPLTRRILRNVVEAAHLLNVRQNSIRPARPEEDELCRRQLQRLDELAGELTEIGCDLKDIHTGLVDFYACYEQQTVELCFCVDDPDLSHWHEIGAGFAGRQPITPEFEQQVEREVLEAREQAAR